MLLLRSALLIGHLGPPIEISAADAGEGARADFAKRRALILADTYPLHAENDCRFPSPNGGALVHPGTILTELVKRSFKICILTTKIVSPGLQVFSGSFFLKLQVFQR